MVLPGDHPLWAPGAAHVFQQLGVGAAITDGTLWRAIYVEPNVTGFEREHGLQQSRNEYNRRCLAEVLRKRGPVLGEHAGFSDWFVPVLVKERVAAVVVSGPFLSSQPTSTSILANWRSLTGRQGRPSDPEFAFYVSTTLSTLTLTQATQAMFSRLLVLLGRLMSGEGGARALLEEIDAVWEKLESARMVERTWEVVRDMVDERTARRWAGSEEARIRELIGLPRMPDVALVGLLVARNQNGDPLDDIVRRDRFQRGSVAMARKTGCAVAGQVGDRGVVFLLAATGSSERKRQRVVDLAEKARAASARLGFDLYVGQSGLLGAATLPEQFQAALGASEMALSRGTWMFDAGPAERAPSFDLGRARRQLGASIEERPAELGARFERYIELVARNSGHRMDPARAHLEAGFERMTDALLAAGTLDPRSLNDLLQTLERASGESRTLAELAASYRRTVADVIDAVAHPATARRDRSLRRALRYIQEHYTEPLTLARVARVAGFAKNYFSALFKERERTTFELYVRKLRVERARELLVTTDLDLERVTRLSGLGTRGYLARLIKHETGLTPSAYRRQISQRS
jgi:AraC-like DNA-binding protein